MISRPSLCWRREEEEEEEIGEGKGKEERGLRLHIVCPLGEAVGLDLSVRSLRRRVLTVTGIWLKWRCVKSAKQKDSLFPACFVHVHSLATQTSRHVRTLVDTHAHAQMHTHRWLNTHLHKFIYTYVRTHIHIYIRTDNRVQFLQAFDS